MRRSLWILVAALVVIVAFSTWAGEKKHKPCTLDTQECLQKMYAKLSKKAWLGIEMDATDDGRYKITRVVPKSPAQSAGFEKGDVLLSMNGHDYSAKDKASLEKAWSEVSPGSEATYVVVRKGGKLKLTAELGQVPEELKAQWIGEHMIHSHLKVPDKEPSD
jgi:predicted metalloprotease with PDZ domain